MAGHLIYFSHEEYNRLNELNKKFIEKGMVKDDVKAFNHSVKWALFTKGVPAWEKELGIKKEGGE